MNNSTWDNFSNFVLIGQFEPRTGESIKLI